MRAFTTVVFAGLLLTCLQVGSAGACTTFCMDTSEGPIFGANLDFFAPADGLIFINRRGIAKQGFSASPSGATAEWVSTYGSVTFSLAGREFAFGGMNEAGLVIGMMELRAGEFPKADERPPLTVGTWAQYVLDTCSSLEDVVHLDARVRIEDEAPANHFLVADANGNTAAIEWLDGRLVVHVGDSLPVKAMSNMRYDRALTAFERGGPRWWWSNPGQSAERFAGAAARNGGYDASRETAVNYAFVTLTQVVAAPHTKWNIVYDIAKREVWFRSAESPNIKHLSLHAFDMSCDAPLLMLDVNAPLTGNVEQSFIPFDHDVNLAVFRTLCAVYDIKVSEKEAVDLMRLIESFECAQPEFQAN